MLNLEDLRNQFHTLDFREKRVGVYKVILPFFYPDGDMYDVFIEESPANSSMLRLSDYGLTLMKLSYTFDIDSSNKEELLDEIVCKNRCFMDDGNIFLDIYPNQFEFAIYQFVQTLTKVGNLEILSRDATRSKFNELLNISISETAKTFEVKSDFTPTADNDLTVDYVIDAPGSRFPVFLYGISNDVKASKVVISCLNFINAGIPHTSLIVHEDPKKLSLFNQNQVTNTCDKQFTNIKDFNSMGATYISRALAS